MRQMFGCLCDNFVTSVLSGIIFVKHQIAVLSRGDGVKSIDQLILNPKKSKGGLRQEKEANRVKSIVLPSNDKFSSMLVMI